MLARLEWAAANSGFIYDGGGQEGKEGKDGKGGRRRKGREKKVNEAVPNQTRWRLSNQANKTR